MNIYKEIAANRRKTILIILLFPLLLGVLLYITLWLVCNFTISDPNANIMGEVNFLAMIILPIITVISLVWMIISYYTGGDMMMSMAGAKEIDRAKNPEVFSLVENVAASAGAPTPRVFIIPTEMLNAFATGRDPQHAAVALTSGIIAKLERPELEAVIAHEMGHIVNRDIRLTMLVSTGIGVLSLVGNILIRVKLKGKDSAKLSLILKIVGLVLVVYGAFLAPVIMYALSRRREYLADASSAYYTRNPLALASALEKISGKSDIESLKGNNLISAACIEKATSVKSFLSDLYATHPPIEERIRILRGSAQQ